MTIYLSTEKAITRSVEKTMGWIPRFAPGKDGTESYWALNDVGDAALVSQAANK